MAYDAGEWWAVCDICGFDYYASQLKENWKGQRVCDKDFETRHPQEFIRSKDEKISVPWVRPPDDVTIATVTGVQAPAATLGFMIYNVDVSALGLAGFTLPAPNSAAYLGIETFLTINNVGATGQIVVNPASGSVKAPAQLVGSASSLNPGESRTYRCIPSQNIWYRER